MPGRNAKNFAMNNAIRKAIAPMKVDLLGAPRHAKNAWPQELKPRDCIVFLG